MVVCEDGRMRRNEYRKFRIRGINHEVHEEHHGLQGVKGARGSREESESAPAARVGVGRHAIEESSAAGRAMNNDFAAMHEVVLRRHRKLLEEGGPFPDLIVIDGGKGQLTAAYTALEELGLANLVAVGIAKKEELLYTRDRSDPIALAPGDPALLLVQRMRDEAHRFAVTFHRRRRTLRDLASELDEIPGVGLRRRRTLLSTFGSVAGVRRASREELVSAVGAKVADAVLAFFASRP
jgi:excinuclease ABC subunit C